MSDFQAQILTLLRRSDAPMTAIAIARTLNRGKRPPYFVTPQQVSAHLSQMKKTGKVAQRRVCFGQTRYERRYFPGETAYVWGIRGSARHNRALTRIRALAAQEKITKGNLLLALPPPAPTTDDMRTMIEDLERNAQWLDAGWA